MAVSAAFPVGLGRYKLDAQKDEWVRYDNYAENKTSKISPRYKKYHLWDGGLYDNFGSEAIFRNWGIKLRENIDYALFSDAGSPLEELGGRNGIKQSFRLIAILSEQIRSLRVRTIFRFLQKDTKKGNYIQIGKSFEDNLKISDDFQNIVNLGPFMSSSEVKKAASYKTNLKIISEEYFDLIEKHGYESAKIKFLTYPLCDTSM